MNISKELFEAVTGTDILNFKYNYNDFFFQCKEWAEKKDKYLFSDYEGYCLIANYWEENAIVYIEQEFRADTEQQAVFDACTWILENK